MWVVDHAVGVRQGVHRLGVVPRGVHGGGIGWHGEGVVAVAGADVAVVELVRGRIIGMPEEIVPAAPTSPWNGWSDVGMRGDVAACV